MFNILQDEEVIRARRERENRGVDLYTMQQQLAKLQMTLERTHDRFGLITKLREQSGVSYFLLLIVFHLRTVLITDRPYILPAQTKS